MDKIIKFINENPLAAMAKGVALYGVYIQWKGSKELRMALLGRRKR